MWRWGRFSAVTVHDATPRRNTCGVSNPARPTGVRRATARSRMSPRLSLSLRLQQFPHNSFHFCCSLRWGYDYFYDKWFVLLGPKRQTAPVTVCLHSKGEYQSLLCGRSSSWEQNLLPDPFFISSRGKLFSSVLTACLELIIQFARDESLHHGIVGSPVAIFKQNDKRCSLIGVKNSPRGRER